MANLNIQLPELILNQKGCSGPVLRYDEGLEITIGVKTDGVFQRVLVGIQNWFDSSKQWVPVKTRDGKIVYVQKSKAAFDKTDRTRAEVIEALYVQKVWKSSEAIKVHSELGYSSFSPSKNEQLSQMVNDGYILRADGTILIKEKSKKADVAGATKKMKVVVDMETGKRLARLMVVTKEKDSANPSKLKKIQEEHIQDRSQRVQKEHSILFDLAEKKVKGVVGVETGFLKKGGKASIFVELLDTSLPSSEKKLPGNVRKKWKTIADQLINGLADMHGIAEIAHNDIKGPNILIRENEDGTIRAVFSDFDLSSRDDFERAGGTLTYFSPEKAKAHVYKSIKFTKNDAYKADVWALGLELYRLRNGEYPKAMQEKVLKARSKDQKAQALMELTQQDNFLREPKDKDSVDHLIWQMLQVDPNQRLSMAQVRKRWNQIKGQ